MKTCVGLNDYIQWSLFSSVFNATCDVYLRQELVQSTWSSLVRGDEGSYQSNGQTNLVIFLCTLSLFCNYISVLAYHLGPLEPSSPSTKELTGLKQYVARYELTALRICGFGTTTQPLYQLGISTVKHTCILLSQYKFESCYRLAF